MILDLYLLIELGKMNVNSSNHATHGTVSSELRLGPHITTSAVLLLLVLQVESRHWRMMRALLSHIAHTTLGSVHNTGESLTNDGVVGLLAAMSLVMPTGQVPLQQSHETLVGVITLEATSQPTRKRSTQGSPEYQRASAYLRGARGGNEEIRRRRESARGSDPGLMGYTRLIGVPGFRDFRRCEKRLGWT